MSPCPMCKLDTIHVAIVIPWDATKQVPQPILILNRCINQTCLQREWTEEPREKHMIKLRIEQALGRMA